MKIRTIKKNEALLLKDLLYLALFVPPGEAPFPKTILEQPAIEKYFSHWGRAGDEALFAELNNQLIGGVWSRLYTEENPGYGFIAPNIPELNIALYALNRSKGYGSQLLNHFLDLLKNKSYPAVSLSVDERNPAYRLYQKFGFKSINQENHSRTMILEF